MSLDFGIWVAGLVTLAIISHVWKENPLYRSAEHLYVGISAGHAVVVAWGNIRDTAQSQCRRKAETIWIIPILLGVLLYTRYFKKIAGLPGIL